MYSVFGLKRNEGEGLAVLVEHHGGGIPCNVEGIHVYLGGKETCWAEEERQVYICKYGLVRLIFHEAKVKAVCRLPTLQAPAL